MMYGTYCRLNLHIGASNIDVIRAARERLKRSARRDRAFRNQRHIFYLTMLRHHREAAGLYYEVMLNRIDTELQEGTDR